MNKLLVVAGLGVFLAIPTFLAAQQHFDARSYDHGEVGAYGDLLRVSPSGSNSANFLGLGGRVGINTGTHVAIEAEMNYDFEQNFTTVSSNGGTVGGTSTTYVSTVRPISGLFGPKFQFGSSGPFRAFLEGKVGFIDFSTSTNAPSGSTFTSAVPGIGGSSTHLAAFPGGGIEAFFGPIGLRVDAGDELWVNNGTYNNLRVTFGPTFRF